MSQKWQHCTTFYYVQQVDALYFKSSFFFDVPVVAALYLIFNDIL